MAIGYNRNNSYKKTFSTETVHLGTFIHTAEDMLVLKLESSAIPYPNSPVIFKSKPIGKVEEVFGQVNDSYVAVKLDSGNKAESFRLETKFEGYKDKFIQKDRFLPREEVEKRKELNDRKKDNAGKKEYKKGPFNKSFDKGKPRRDNFDNKRSGFGNKNVKREGGNNRDDRRPSRDNSDRNSDRRGNRDNADRNSDRRPNRGSNNGMHNKDNRKNHTPKSD